MLPTAMPKDSIAESSRFRDSKRFLSVCLVKPRKYPFGLGSWSHDMREWFRMQCGCEDAVVGEG